MKWKTANDVGVEEPRPQGMWTRDELDEEVEQQRNAETSLRRSLSQYIAQNRRKDAAA